MSYGDKFKKPIILDLKSYKEKKYWGKWLKNFQIRLDFKPLIPRIS